MKRNKLLTLSSAFLLVALFMNSCKREQIEIFTDNDPSNLMANDSRSGDIIPGEYIVVLNENNNSSLVFKKTMSFDERNELVQNSVTELLIENKLDNVKVENLYSSTVIGFLTNLTENEVKQLSSDKRIASIEPNRIFLFAKGGKGGGNGGGKGGKGGKGGTDTFTQPAQITPAGITRVGGAGNHGNKRAWIIDSGIDFDHPDLNVNTSLSKSFISGVSADDEHGHGTHVAGIIGAIDNTIGTVGVAAGAQLVSVKVIDKYGGSTTANILSGIDYVGSNASAGDVANISLGLYISASIDSAVAKAARKGIYFALAAGNNSSSATNISPARVNGTNIFTVSAMGSGDYWASFSSYGNPPVDYCEPGVDIYSTYLGGKYTIMSGTSMAAPHLAGILLITGGAPKSTSYVKNDPDNTADPIGQWQ